jgi:hypothetical protein
MLQRVVMIALACTLTSVGLSDEQPRDGAGARMFDRMRSLVGTWEGTFEWTGSRTGSGKLLVIYHLTGNGSALVEDLIMGEAPSKDDAPSMTTVYHLDGSDLRMTHFCGAMNQPRLKAGHIDEASATASFSLVDVTNATSHPAYVDGFSLHIVDADDLNIQFKFGGTTGKRAVENIVVKRTGAPEAPKTG